MLPEVTKEIPVIQDGDSLMIMFTGGLRAWKQDNKSWLYGPVMHHGAPHLRGLVTTDELQRLIGQAGLRAIAFLDFSVLNGEHHSSVRAITGKSRNHVQSAANLWRNIESKFPKERIRLALQDNPKLTFSEINVVVDNKIKLEAAAGYISDSLRALDLSIAEICDFYNEQLLNSLRLNRSPDVRFSTSADLTLYAHIHAFFLQLGSARDYLAKFIAARVDSGGNVDAMNKLVRWLRKDSLPDDPIINYLISSGNIAPDPASTKMKQDGWLTQVGDLRNRLVHQQPYGSISCETRGFIVKIDEGCGISRYCRLISLPERSDLDALDVIAYHYRMCCELFLELARISNMDHSMLTITDDDIISFEEI